MTEQGIRGQHLLSNPAWLDSCSDHFSVSVQSEMSLVGPRVHGSSAGEALTSSGIGPASSGSGVSQGPMLQFFSKLRRHASLEGTSPYFKIKKWKLDSSQRASSLDTRGNVPR